MPATETVKVTRPCQFCRAELHLVQDSTGSMWQHATAHAELACWRAHRDEYEAGL